MNGLNQFQDIALCVIGIAINLLRWTNATSADTNKFWQITWSTADKHTQSGRIAFEQRFNSVLKIQDYKNEERKKNHFAQIDRDKKAERNERLYIHACGIGCGLLIHTCECLPRRRHSLYTVNEIMVQLVGYYMSND